MLQQAAPILQHVLTGNQTGENIHITPNRTNIQTSTMNSSNVLNTSIYSSPIKRPLNTLSNPSTYVSSTV